MERASRGVHRYNDTMRLYLHPQPTLRPELRENAVSSTFHRCGAARIATNARAHGVRTLRHAQCNHGL
eukprot:4930389-Lingulodinium_polyedra.AAC.1